MQCLPLVFPVARYCPVLDFVFWHWSPFATFNFFITAGTPRRTCSLANSLPLRVRRFFFACDRSGVNWLITHISKHHCSKFYEITIIHVKFSIRRKTCILVTFIPMQFTYADLCRLINETKQIRKITYRNSLMELNWNMLWMNEVNKYRKRHLRNNTFKNEMQHLQHAKL